MITAKTSACLLFCFFFCHAVFNCFKITDSFTCFSFCKIHSSARCTVIQMCLRDFNIAGNFMMISKILINVGCNNLCGRDCLDNRSRSACTVPSCKYSRKILKCSRTFSNDLTTFNRDTRLFEVMCLNILSNCYD